MIKKKYKKAVGGMIVGGAALGLGSQVLGSVGGSAASSAQAGIGKVSGAMPVMGSIVGAGMVVDSLGRLKKSAKMRR